MPNLFIDVMKGQADNLPNKFSLALGELIRNARIESKLSQKELATDSYINQAAISLIEAGKRSVSTEEIVYLSRALNKPIQYFFSMEFVNPIEEKNLSILEQELIHNARFLSENDLKKIIAQIKAVINL